jgi:uncharacterized hydrophobic protein (TIGR00271 family)
MLRLRVAAPADLTDAVVEVLSRDPAVSSLSALRGASLRPEGDLVQADVAREAANDVINRLRDLGVHEEGSLHVEPVRAWMSRRGLEADQRSPGSSADAVVWADVTQQAYEDSELNWTYGSFMVLATVIAAIAIVLDSQILVIGAMVLGPEFGAVAALGVALVRRRATLFARAARTLVLGFAVAIALTTVASLAAGALGWVTISDVTGSRPETAFIYTPDKWSFIVAVIAARRVHLGHHGAGSGQRRPGTGLRRLARGGWQPAAARRQPCRDGGRGLGDARRAADRVVAGLPPPRAAGAATPGSVTTRDGRLTPRRWVGTPCPPRGPKREEEPGGAPRFLPRRASARCPWPGCRPEHRGVVRSR